MENNKYSFWKLLKKYLIEIPIIQRDYAQGREEETNIRKNFLEAIHKKLVEDKDNPPMNLDFVYGEIKNEKLLTPLDGQQRLTTLFLLHWYLAPRDNENKIKEEYRNLLEKFTYETRITSRDFCNELVSEQLNKNLCIKNNEEQLSIYIKEQKWFYESWLKDPTIKSMLKMLDAIDLKFKKESNFFEKLITNELNKAPITFQYLPLDNFGLTDELYIKMNARGKTLTDFENFKANFERYLDKSDIHKMDNIWTDLFWEYKTSKDGYFFIDEKFLNFFTNMTLNLYVEKNELKVKKKIDDINIFDIYETVYEDKENVNRITILLDSLCNIINIDNPLYKYKEYFDVFIGHKEEEKKNDNELKLSYWHRARFYSLSLFLIKYKTIDDSNIYKLKKWLRVTFNLINNQLIQSPALFMNVIKGLKKLSENIDNIYEDLASKNTILGFNERQSEEEILKASLILKDNKWETLLEDGEQHWYLNGQIGFLLKYSFKDGDTSINLFKNYLEKFKLLFTEDVLNNNNYLIQRALLAKGDYLPSIKSNYTFCSSETALRTKEDNWRKVFNDFDEDSEITYIFKKLLDDISLEKDIEFNLENIFNTFDEEDWREGFIKEPLIIDYCKRLQIRFENENDILLLSKERTSGIHAEYYSYWLYLELKNSFPNKKIEYYSQNSVDLTKYISLEDEKIYISYDCYDNAWQYEKEQNEEFEYFESKEELIKSLNF